MDRKAMVREYKERARPAGVFAVHNTTDDKMFVGVSADLVAMLNRQRFQLEMGLHPDKELQTDWERVGTEGFSFDVLDELEPTEGSDSEIKDDLRTLGEMWVGRLTAAGQRLYSASGRG